jgi:hypothetical protein
MARAFFLILMLVLSLDAAVWSEKRSFTLKKDETAHVLIKTASPPKLERLLTWRWTLYTDNTLIVHEKFDRIVGQHVLDVGHGDSFRKPLLPSIATERDVPYVVVIFKKFDDQNKTALFDLLIFDKNKRILVDYLDKEKNQ